MIRFSIIIPVYNVEKYLDECVQSVVAQTYRNFEIILVDDGSRDSSGRCCDHWAEKDTRIRVIHQENQGLSGARNTGIRAAVGEYLIFLDSDDWWNGPDVLETVSRRLDATCADVLSFSYQKVYGDRREDSYFGDQPNVPVDLKMEESLRYMLKNELWISCAWNKAIRRQLMQSHDLMFRLGISSEDIDWTLRLGLYAQSFDYIKTVVVFYRQRQNSISHTVSIQRMKDLCGNIETCLQLLSGQQRKVEILRPFVAYQYATVLFNLAGLRKQERSPELLNRVKEMLPLLQWSDNSKVKMIRICNNALGFSATVWLLRCWAILRNLCTGGAK